MIPGSFLKLVCFLYRSLKTLIIMITFYQLRRNSCLHAIGTEWIGRLSIRPCGWLGLIIELTAWSRKLWRLRDRYWSLVNSFFVGIASFDCRGTCVNRWLDSDGRRCCHHYGCHFTECVESATDALKLDSYDKSHQRASLLVALCFTWNIPKKSSHYSMWPLISCLNDTLRVI